MPNNTFELKQKIRNIYNKKREQLTLSQKNEYNERICQKMRTCPEYQTSAVILAYSPLPQEVDITPILTHALKHNKQLILPAVNKINHELDLYQVHNLTTDLIKGPFKTKEPKSKSYLFPKTKIDLIFVPGIAFDKAGNRLGYGHGYYDKLLANLTCAKIGIAFGAQITAANIPTESHDQRVHKIITEEGTITCS